MCLIQGCINEYFDNGYCFIHYQIERPIPSFGRNRLTNNNYLTEGNICKIGCYNQHSELTGYAIIDLKHMLRCKPYKWTFDGKYVINVANKLRLHHVILEITPPTMGDHKDGNTWNNLENNLRIATSSENNCNKSKYKNNKGSYKGVYLINGKFRAQIAKDDINYYLGTYENPEEAALAYNKASKELHKEFARLNII